ncbi:unnamed protein product [Parnassius mnemosyne]
MPLSAAERCRRYRENLRQSNPEKYDLMKKKNAERTKAKKRKIANMSEDEKLAMRKKWRDAKRNKKDEKVEKLVVPNNDNRQRRKYRSKLLRENRILKEKNKNLCVTNGSLKKTILRYRKKINTLTNQLNQLKTENTVEPTKSPTTPLKKYIEEEIPDISVESKQKIRKKLLETRVLQESLKETYNDSKSNEEKNVLKKLLVSESVKKYNMQFKIRKYLGLKRGIRHYYSIKQKKIRTAKELTKFFERDDISRMTAGKKECVTRQKIKKQKRFLLNTLSNLYKIYRSEGGILSFASFKRYRPFYVVSPHVSNRNTCACIKHANLAFKAQTLKKLGLISSADPNDLISKIVCDIKSKSCMYSECTVCYGKKLSFAFATDTQEVSWLEWTTKNYEYGKSNARKTTKKTVKEEKIGTLNTLADMIQKDLVKFKYHHFNIYHQHKQYKEAIENIKCNEIIIHCDFSENYSCKMAKEVQSMHFAGSRQQITLHTGVAYVKNEKPISFCSVSPSLKHDPQAIWGHLEPVIFFFKEKYPAINCVHFYSDGPTTQYRQKKNFWLFGEKTKEDGFVQATWSFFEASHGKGAADGVGGAIKRILDSRVSYGEDIVDAKSAFDVLSKADTTIKLFYVTEDSIKKVENPQNIQPVPNTMKIHQIIATDDKRVIKYRSLSCFCARGACECFSPKVHNFKQKPIKVSCKKSDSRTKKKKIKKEINSSKRARKIYKESDTTSEDTDTSEIQYADTDDDYTSFDDEMTTGEIETEIVYETNRNSKVKVLSEVRFTPENQAYFNLSNYGPLTLTPIDCTNFNLCSQNEKENITHANPDSCSSKDKDTDVPELYKISDSILVRYYQRKSWKYYVGFIDKIEIKDDDTFYEVHFLKTIKEQDSNIKFIKIPKNKDFDIVTNVSIVKKVKLTALEKLGEYSLTEDCDEIYF